MSFLKYLLICAYLLIYFKSEEQVNTFIRPSITTTVVNSNNPNIQALNQLIVKNNSYFINRFNDISIQNFAYTLGKEDVSQFKDYTKSEKDLLTKELQKKYSNISSNNINTSKEMISYLFDYQNESFSYDRMLDLAKISATDNQLLAGMNSKDKTKVFLDLSDEMLKKIYIINVIVRRVETYEEYYNRVGIQQKDRTDYGYRCEADYYVTKVFWSSENSNYFFDECWVDVNTPENQKVQKIKNYQNMEMKTECIFSDRIDFSSVQRKLWANHPTYGRTMNELFNSLPDWLFGLIIEKLSSISFDFKIASSLSSTYPCTAKIGTKEGVNLGTRYFGCEKIIKKDGETKFKRKGILRVNEIGDNKLMTATTKFQQQGGKKLYDGMYIFEDHPKALNFVFSKNVKYSSKGINLDQYNLNFKIGPFGKTRKERFKNRYIGLNLGFSSFNNVKYKLSDTILSSGFSVPLGLEFNREIYFTKKGNLFLFPSLLVRGTTIGLFAKNKDSQIDSNNNGIWDVNEFNESRGTPMFLNTTIGLGLGLHLGPRFSLIYRPLLSYNLLALELSPFKMVNSNTLDGSWGFEYGFLNNFSNSFSLRIQF